MRIIPRKPAPKPETASSNKSNIPENDLPLAIKEKVDMLAPYLDKSEDIIKRSFMVGSNLKIPAQAVYINQIIDTDVLNRQVLEPLMQHGGAEAEALVNNVITMLSNSSLPVGQVMKVRGLREVVHNIYDGLVVVLVDGCQEALVIDIHGGEYRAVDEPPGERTARGPREGFVENMDINISMIRRRLRDPNLVVKKTMVGRRTRTPVAILYIEDIASLDAVNDLRKRLDAIDTDGIVATGFIEQFIEKSPWSPFPQVWSSERPDRLTMKLLEGRIVLIAHGTPLAITAPTLALEFFQASEDYYERTIYSSFTRFVRFCAFFLAVSLPALYIGLLSFHPELMPLKLLVPLAQSRTQVPFPALLEALIQLFIIEMVIESGLRLPGSVGQTVGVVAGIILGQAAIAAKLASPAVIIVIAVTTIATYVMPSSGMLLASRILRIPLIMVSAVFGIFGFSMGWLLIVIHVAALQDFGAAYYSPFAPIRWSDAKDSAFRTFLWKMDKRPLSIPHQDSQRQGQTRPESRGKA